MPIVPLALTCIEFNPANDFSESSIEIDSDVLKRLCDGLNILDAYDIKEQPAKIYWENGLFKLTYCNMEGRVTKTIGSSRAVHPDNIKKMSEWSLSFSPKALKKPLSTFKKNVKIRMFQESRAGWTALTVDGKNIQRFPVNIVDVMRTIPEYRHKALDERAVLISYSEFMEALDAVEDFTDKKDNNGRLNWIYLRIQGGAVTLAGTDSKRAAVHVPKTVWVTDETRNTHIPLWLNKVAELLIMSSDASRDCVLTITPVMSEDDKEVANVRINGGECEIEYNARLHGMLSHDTIVSVVDKSLPNDGYRRKLEIDRHDIERFMKVADAFKCKNNDMSLILKDDKWSLFRINDELGEISYAVKLNHIYGPLVNGLQFKVNSKFLKDAIAALYKKEKKGVEQRVIIEYGQTTHGFLILSNGKTSTVLACLK